MKVLFCSPYSDAPEAIKGGINTWGRYIVDYYEQFGKNQVELIPVSLDRSVFAATSKTLIRRVFNGCHDQMKPVRRAVRLMDSENPSVVHICTSGGLGSIRDLLLVCAAKKEALNLLSIFTLVVSLFSHNNATGSGEFSLKYSICATCPW